MTKRLTLRLSDETLDAIESVALRHRISKSDVVRMALEDRLSDLPTTTMSQQDYVRLLQTIDAFRNELAKVDASIAKTGVNLNQVTRVINRQKGITQQQLASVLRLTDYLNNIRSYIYKMSESVNKLIGGVTQD